MGGIVATLFANARPDLVAGLVLIESGMLPMNSDELDRLNRTLLEWPAPFKDTEAAAEFFGADAAATPAWIASLEPTPDGLQPRFDAAVMVTTMEELAGSDRWDEWKSISTPTLICRADQSSISDEDINGMKTLRPDVPVTVIAGAGHDIHLDQPQQLADLITRFVTRNGRAIARRKPNSTSRSRLQKRRLPETFFVGSDVPCRRLIRAGAAPFLEHVIELPEGHRNVKDQPTIRPLVLLRLFRSRPTRGDGHSSLGKMSACWWSPFG